MTDNNLVPWHQILLIKKDVQIERLRAENDALKTAPESALSIEQLRAERAVGFREGYEAAMKGRP